MLNKYKVYTKISTDYSLKIWLNFCVFISTKKYIAILILNIHTWFSVHILHKWCILLQIVWSKCPHYNRTYIIKYKKNSIKYNYWVIITNIKKKIKIKNLVVKRGKMAQFYCEKKKHTKSYTIQISHVCCVQ